jgi:hypothetical protein
MRFCLNDPIDPIEEPLPTAMRIHERHTRVLVPTNRFRGTNL